MIWIASDKKTATYMYKIDIKIYEVAEYVEYRVSGTAILEKKKKKDIWHIEKSCIAINHTLKMQH